MSRRDVLLGQYGTIPDDVYLRKIEVSGIDEDPRSYEKFLRRELSDFRPEKPFFESDQPRDPSDRGGGTHAKEFLNIRYGGLGLRTDVTPYLPDGTFLDWEFLERDPRGTQNLPDFAEARRQRMARGAFIKLSSDEDHSVTERMLNPVQMRNLIRNAQGQSADRFINFTDARDSWHNGRNQTAPANNQLAIQENSGAILNIAEALGKNRPDYVAQLSNNIAGLQRSSAPDHRVKVSRYGRVRPSGDIGAANWNNNRYNAYLDHTIPVDIGGQLVNRGLALMILDLQGQRANKQISAQGAQYGDSETVRNRQTRDRINPEDLYKLIQLSMVSPSASDPAHALLGADMNNRSPGDAHLFNPRNLFNEVQINHELAESIVLANKLGQKPQRENLRDEVKQSAANSNLYIQAGNRSLNNKGFQGNLDVRGEVKMNHAVEDSKQTKNYAAAVPVQAEVQDLVAFNPFGDEATETKVKVRNFQAKHKQLGDSVDDVSMEEFRATPAPPKLDSRYKSRGYAHDFGDTKKRESR